APAAPVPPRTRPNEAASAFRHGRDAGFSVDRRRNADLGAGNRTGAQARSARRARPERNAERTARSIAWRHRAAQGRRPEDAGPAARPGFALDAGDPAARFARWE